VQQENKDLMVRVSALELNQTDFAVQSSLFSNRTDFAAQASTYSPTKTPKPTTYNADRSPLNLPSSSSYQTNYVTPPPLRTYSPSASKQQNITFKKLVVGLSIGLDDPPITEPQPTKARLSRDKASAKIELCPDVIHTSEQWNIAKETLIKSVSCQNFAGNLMMDLFDHRELLGRNCRGWKKPALSKDKLDIVHSFCWKFFPADMMGGGNWKGSCTPAIDEMLRRVNRKHKPYTTRILKI